MPDVVLETPPAPPPPEVIPQPASSPAAPTPPEGNDVITAIEQSQQAGDEPRETLTKIAKLKKMGTYAVTGLMVISAISQILSTAFRENEGQTR